MGSLSRVSFESSVTEVLILLQDFESLTVLKCDQLCASDAVSSGRVVKKMHWLES